MALRSAGLIDGLASMVNTIKSNISTKFKAFYLKRVHEVDLAPTKTFNYDFDIGSSSSSSHRRSLSKLKALLIKSVLKNNPVVALASTEFLPIENNNSQLRLNLFEVEIGSVIPAINAKVFKTSLRLNRLEDRSVSSVTLDMVKSHDRMSRAVIESSMQYLSILRYTRYLEYLARKSGVPVAFRAIHSRQEFNSNSISVKYDVYIEVTFTGWIPGSPESETRYRRVLEGVADDELFHSRHWSSISIEYVPPEYKFHVARFFLHLDKALKVANTLTRKIDYGYSAFSFRTA